MAKQNIDLKAAFEEITNKVTAYDELYSYYDGNPTLKYSNERLQRAFDDANVHFSENWASVIVNAILDRLILKGFDAGDDTVNAVVDEIFTRLNLNLDAQDVHEAVQVTGEAFLIVDQTEDGVEVYFNDPRMCVVYYDGDKPKQKAFAAKKWDGANKVSRMNLYYPDRTEKYESKTQGQTANSFELIETVSNPTGIIPVFHFKDSRRVTKGELDPSIISILDAINKLFSDLMVAAEFEAFKLRVFVTQADIGDIKIGPDMKLTIPARETGEGEDTQVLELGGTDLQKFMQPITDLATHLAIQTRTPRHYFMNTGSNLSGESLIVEESALVKKVTKKQEAYAPEWQAAMAYVLELNGIVVDPRDLVPVWEKVQSEQPLTNAQVFQTNKNAGIPVITTARRMGWSEDEIEQLKVDMSEDREQQQQNMLAQANAFNNQ